MVTDHLTDRTGLEPILPFKWSVTIGTMKNFNDDEEGTCKQPFSLNTFYSPDLHLN